MICKQCRAYYSVNTSKYQFKICPYSFPLGINLRSFYLFSWQIFQKKNPISFTHINSIWKLLEKIKYWSIILDGIPIHSIFSGRKFLLKLIRIYILCFHDYFNIFVFDGYIFETQPRGSVQRRTGLCVMTKK